MKYFTLVTGLAVCAVATAAAQAATPTKTTSASHVTNSSRPYSSARISTPRVTSFRAFATKLNTTTPALDSVYKTAETANHKLTRGQFIEANLLADNLGAKYPAVTQQAILDGLKAGKSMGKTLQSLGLSPKDADKAQSDAVSEMRRLERAPVPKDSTK